MTKQLMLVAAVLALQGCTKPQGKPGAQRTAIQPAQPPRTFSEKMQCAAVGERYDRLMCGVNDKRERFCHGWWAYNAKRDTCVGVFVHTTLVDRKPFQTLYVLDLLTGAELEETCAEQRCPVDAAKSRWILGGSEPSPPAPPGAAK